MALRAAVGLRSGAAFSGLRGGCLRFGGGVFSRRLPSAACVEFGERGFASYCGQKVTSEQLLKKSDDWVIEETNFCLGRVAPIRFKETDDFAHRVLHLMDAQLGKMHTRLRDGTCVPVMGLYIPCILDKPTPLHQCLETPLLKYTWDETYTEAFE